MRLAVRDLRGAGLSAELKPGEPALAVVSSDVYSEHIFYCIRNARIEIFERWRSKRTEGAVIFQELGCGCAAAVCYSAHHGEHLAGIGKSLILTYARPAAVDADRILEGEIALGDIYSVYRYALVEADLLGGLCQRVVAELLGNAGEGAVAGFAQRLLEIDLSVDGVALDDTRRGLVLTGAGKGARIYIGYFL